MDTAVHTYAAADAVLHHARTKRPVPTRRVANNTYLERRGESIALRLHDTDVVLYRPNGTVSLFTGGWYTQTTMDRLNTWTPLSIITAQGMWWINLRHEVKVPFFEGATTTEDGYFLPVPQTIWAERDRHLAHNAQMRRLISRYVSRLTPDVVALVGRFPGWMVSPGAYRGATRGLRDTFLSPCGLCLPTIDAKTIIGDEMDNTRHLVDHMLDGTYSYFVLRDRTGYFRNRRELRAWLSRRLLVGPTNGNHPLRPPITGKKET